MAALGRMRNGIPEPAVRRRTKMNTPILNMTAKEAAIVNQCYAVLTEDSKDKGYEAVVRLAKLMAEITVRNIRAGRAKPSDRNGERQGSEL